MYYTMYYRQWHSHTMYYELPHFSLLVVMSRGLGMLDTAALQLWLIAYSWCHYKRKHFLCTLPWKNVKLVKKVFLRIFVLPAFLEHSTIKDQSCLCASLHWLQCHQTHTHTHTYTHTHTRTHLYSPCWEVLAVGALSLICVKNSDPHSSSSHVVQPTYCSGTYWGTECGLNLNFTQCTGAGPHCRT